MTQCRLRRRSRLLFASNAETHRLGIVPASIDGKPLTLNSLRALANEAGKDKDPIFRAQNWYDKEAFAAQLLIKSAWVLEYETMAPDAGGKRVPQVISHTRQ